MGELEFGYPHEFEASKEGFEQRAATLVDKWKQEGYTHVRASLHTNQCVPLRKEDLPSAQELEEHHRIYELDDLAAKRALIRWYLTEHLFTHGGRSGALQEREESFVPDADKSVGEGRLGRKIGL